MDCIYDLTKDDFFSTYEEFSGVYNNRDIGQMRKFKLAENTFRYSPKSKDMLNTHREHIKL
jgi:hypothetical protein